MLGRQLEQAGFPSGVLHGGKTQARNRRNCRCGGARCCSCCVTPWAPFTVAEHGHERQKQNVCCPLCCRLVLLFGVRLFLLPADPRWSTRPVDSRGETFASAAFLASAYHVLNRLCPFRLCCSPRGVWWWWWWWWWWSHRRLVCLAGPTRGEPGELPRWRVHRARCHGRGVSRPGHPRRQGQKIENM